MKHKLNKKKRFGWSKAKNKILKKQRRISFPEFSKYIQSSSLVDIWKHPNRRRYPHQKIFIVKKKGYAYSIPFVEDNNKYFLKTIYPDRKATKKYLTKEDDQI